MPLFEGLDDDSNPVHTRQVRLIGNSPAFPEQWSVKGEEKVHVQKVSSQR